MDNMDDLGVPPFMETPKWYQMMLNECKQHTNVAPGKKTRDISDAIQAAFPLAANSGTQAPVTASEDIWI